MYYILKILLSNFISVPTSVKKESEIEIHLFKPRLLETESNTMTNISTFYLFFFT